MANAHPEIQNDQGVNNASYVTDVYDDTDDSESIISQTSTQTSMSFDETHETDFQDVEKALEFNTKTSSKKKRNEYEDNEELQSPFVAKVVATLVMVFCGFFVGCAAYSEAILASKIRDRWMRGLRIKNSYVISSAGIFLGVCMWSLTIWLLNSYLNT